MPRTKGLFWSLLAAGVLALVALTAQHFAKSKACAVEPGPARLAGADVIVGRAIFETTVRAPLSGRECVYWTAMVTKPADQNFSLSDSRTSIVGLQTASGERIGFSGDSVRYVLSSVSATETKSLALRDMPIAIRALLKRDGEDDVEFEVIETTITPSSTIYATGVRMSAGELRVQAIYDAPPRPPVVRPEPAL